MMFLKTQIRPCILFIVSVVTIGCGPNYSKMSDHALTQRMREATSDKTGRVVTKGKLYDGYDLTITGDSLEWYSGPNQAGKRYTAEVHDVDAVTIKHAHDNWPLIFTLGGFGTGALIGSYYEIVASGFASVDGKDRPFNIVTPLVLGVGCAGLGYLGGTYLDPGVAENAWIHKINTPRGER